MSENIKLIKQVFDKTQFNNTIDKEFVELGSKTSSSFFDIELATVEDFFKLYQKLFFNIPKEGLVNSHEYLIQQSSDYTGTVKENQDIKSLLDEIDFLREENIKITKQNIRSIG